jgi:hypothetical protein
MTSLNTTFFVLFDSSHSLVIHLRDDRWRALDNATYNWSWVNTGCRRSTPTMSNVWPCDLLIVIAKERETGNWRRRSLNGMSGSAEINLMRGTKTVVPLKSCTFKTLVLMCWTIPLEPLHTPSRGCRLHRIIIEQPIFRTKRATGNPEGVNVCRCSGE